MPILTTPPPVDPRILDTLKRAWSSPRFLHIKNWPPKPSEPEPIDEPLITLAQVKP